MKLASMDGLIVVDKPSGLTSHDVVLRVRRLLGGGKTGHCGTLDPDATGILLVTVGKATRLFPYLSGSGKTYFGTMRLGFSTDTYDASGRPTSPESADLPPEDAVREAMKGFEGLIRQIPPPYSAKKLNGKPLYKLARANQEVSPKPQEVRVFNFTLESWRPPLVDFKTSCASGTYIRSLAHDLGRLMGCGAHLTSLRRVRSGEFEIGDSHGLEEVERLGGAGSLGTILVPMEKLLPGFPVLSVGDEAKERVRHGNSVPGAGEEINPAPSAEEAPASASGTVYRLLDREGKLLALARKAVQEGEFAPFLVLFD